MAQQASQATLPEPVAQVFPLQSLASPRSTVAVALAVVCPQTSLSVALAVEATEALAPSHQSPEPLIPEAVVEQAVEHQHKPIGMEDLADQA